MKNGKLVGVATSRGYSYYFRQMLSLCTIDVAQSEPGTEVDGGLGQSRHTAEGNSRDGCSGSLQDGQPPRRPRSVRLPER